MQRSTCALRGGPLAAAILIATLTLALVGPARGAQRDARTVAPAGMVRVGVAPPPPRRAQRVAGASRVSPLELTVALSPRDPRALAAYARAVSAPSSAEYRRFLTTAQFRARFAPRPATVAAVRRSLRAHGLRPGAVDASGLALPVGASDAAAAHAFDLTLAHVRLPGGRDAIYNLQAPALDRRIAPDVQAVLGLSTLYPQHDALARPPRRVGRALASPQIATGGPQACPQAVNEAPGYGGYTADQIASYYDFAPLYRAGDKGSGVTVAVYELESDSPSDIAAYQRCYGTHTRISYVKVDGGAGAGSGSGEAALDIDQFIGLSPRVRLIVYQGPNSNSGAGPYDVYAAIANQDRAQVVSSSWGSCEPQETATSARAERTVFEQMAIQGQTMVAAAGDSGSEDCFLAGTDADNSLEVDDPASQPFVTAVGGTSLELGDFNLGGASNPLYPTPNPPETVWNNSYPGLQYHGTWGIQPGAGGGGISKLWPMPAYQASALAAPWLDGSGNVASGTPCGAPAGHDCRELPDVSANADPMDGYMTFWNGGARHGGALSGWQSIGGTSAATPVWAAIFALADASRACAGNLVGFVNPALYALASSSQATYASDFNDVSDNAINAAGNDNDLLASGNTSALYPAGPGYDLASGLGTPHAANIVAGLCATAPRLRTAGARRSFVGAGVKIRLRLELPAGAPKRGAPGRVSYSASHLPKGLRVNRGDGVISGRIKAPGEYHTVLGARTASGQYGALAFPWSVARRPVVSALSLAGLLGRRPTLAFTISAGAFESPLRRVSVELPAGIALRRPLRGITVTGALGRPLAHRVVVVDARVEVSFAPAHTPVRVVFGAGALVVSPTLRLRLPRRLALVVDVLDARGHASAITGTVAPLAAGAPTRAA